MSAVTEFRGSHGMEEGKGDRYLASGRQYGNALLGVRHQEEECLKKRNFGICVLWLFTGQMPSCCRISRIKVLNGMEKIIYYRLSKNLLIVCGGKCCNFTL